MRRHAQPFLLNFLLLFAALQPATAQTPFGDFQPASSWWIGPGTTTGIVTDGTTLTIDTDGDGLIEASDNEHPHPAAIVGANLRLTPSRTVLYAFGAGSGACTGGAQVWFYAIPATEGQALAPLTGPICIPQGIAHEGFFDQPLWFDQRIAYIAGIQHPTTLQQQILWVNLSDGSNAWTDASFNPDIGFVQFSPSAIAAFIQHDLPTIADYRVVKLCPGQLGSSYNITNNPLNDVSGITPNAVVVEGADGEPDILVEQDGNPLALFDADDCSPPTGGCCLTSGSCFDDITESVCGTVNGTWGGDGVPCAQMTCTPPPMVSLAISVAAPAGVSQGQTFPLQINYANNGTLAAAGVTIVETIPAQSIFVSASGGGNYNSATRKVTWNVGALADGASGQFTVDLTTGCFISSLVNNDCRITATNGITAIAPTVTIPVGAASSSPINLSVSSVAQDPLPLGDGEQVLVTITLDNPSSDDHFGIRLLSVGSGAGMRMGTVLDDGNGTVTSFPTSMSWVGDLPGLASRQIQFLLDVDPCRQRSITQTQLHNGAMLQLQRACGGTLATASSSDIHPVEPPPLSVRLLPADGTGVCEWFGIRGLQVRDQERVELMIELENTSSSPQPATFSMNFPAALTPDGNPPFVGSPAAGFSWNSGNNSVQFNGNVPGNSTVRAVFAGIVAGSDLILECRTPMSGTGGSAGCTGNLFSNLSLWIVPAPPTDDQVLVADVWSGALGYGPGDSTVSRVVCVSGEIFTGIDEIASNDYLVAGLPVIRVNPESLDMECFDPVIFGMNLAQEAVVDPTDGSWVISGQLIGSGLLSIRRYDPVAATTAVIFDDSAQLLGNVRRMVVEADGHLGFLDGNFQLVRMDPGDPANFQRINGPWTAVSSIVLEADGDYLVQEAAPLPSSPRPLYEVDPETAVVATVVADLNLLAPGTSLPFGAALSPDGVYYSIGQSRLLQAYWLPTSGAQLAFFNSPADLLWASGSGAPTSLDPPSFLPQQLRLHAAAPNPFNPRTTIRFDLPEPSRVTVDVIDARGRGVARLTDRLYEAGFHQLSWTAEDGGLASGVYYLQLTAGSTTRTQKLLLLK